MEWFFRLELFSILVLAPQLVVLQIDYNITDYTNPLPDDIKPLVQKALRLEQTGENDDCVSEEETICPPMKFSQISGHCNNVRHPNWGCRGQKYLRFKKPDYNRGSSLPRESPTAHKLPNPSEVASAFQEHPAGNHESVTALLGSWGEFLLNDLVSTGNMKSRNCCGEKRGAHRECYVKFDGEKCLEYMRTLPAVDDTTCVFEYRNQMNLATSFLDGSTIYGNTDEEMKKIRLFTNGQIEETNCQACFFNPLYTLFIKEHNRIANELRKLNHKWTDEMLFHESRKIVIAQIQHVTYNEFLPLLLGEETIKQSQLELKNHGRYSKYSSNIRAGVFNEVAIGVLPALLSLIPSKKLNKTLETTTEMFSNLASSPAKVLSSRINVQVRSDWDSFALFVHMGRDHGVPSYLRLREACNNETFKTYINFEELEAYGIGKSDYKILKSLFGVASDVDLIVGGILEENIPGAILGPTFNCLLKHQFKILRESDRFWYENDIPPSSFTVNQLEQIKKVTLAGLICANTDLPKMQPQAFLQEDPYLNSAISCQHFQQLGISEWTDHAVELSSNLFKDALSKAEQDFLERRQFEYNAWLKVGGVSPKSPQGTAVAFSKANKGALKLANSSLLYELASNEILSTVLNNRKKRHLLIDDDFPIFRNEIINSLQNFDFGFVSNFHHKNHFESSAHCDETGPCNSRSAFRSYTGHCNNLKNPDYGKSLSTFSRLLPSVYEDGISKPRRTSVTGLPLPNPRIISRTIHPDISHLHSRYTLMTMQFAQLLDHDISLTPVHKGFEESIPDCRSCDSKFTVHPECDPLPIPPGDDYYPEFNITTGERMCLHSMRSLPGQQHFGPREQINMNSAFLDASMIYGENPCKAKNLKGTNGLMNYTTHPVRGKDLLPQTHKHPECKSASGLCFDAGDPRASEQPALTSIHTIFMREHNRLSDILSKINSHWNEEQIFEHVRRIVIAEFQHIVYNEFLPRILGWSAMNLYELKLSPSGYYRGYDPDCNPAVINEFAAAAFRIGHSLLRPHIPRVNVNYEILHPPILLRDGFFKMDMMMRENMVDEITRGLISTPVETLDQFITGEVTNHLFEDRNIPFSGIDLISRNLQRARDHGIPSYNNYRVLCNLKRANTFEDLYREMSPESIARLKNVYAHVDDIDLFPGGMSERSLKGGLVGPTFGCIIGLQFKKMRQCDRFWYESHDPAVRFTEQQLSEIKKITLSKILCSNMDVEGYIQKDAFDLPTNFLNPRVPCHSLPAINMNAWKEFGGNTGCIIGDKYVRVGEGNFPTPCTSCVCTPQGGNCASLKITDCQELLRFWPRETIVKDEVCTAQCGFLLKDSTATSFQRITHHGSSQLKNRLSLFPNGNSDNFHDFGFADFSHFLKK
ncbi:unnamed protein product [Phyllotreta striolata]|uniref:Peroxidase n=1 Tax=Phyllotreta striolata TaxID=444603 RepID=A0A9P0DWD6_PHYSR|nr:unnamed protein product [Phyllotreta striolata]